MILPASDTKRTFSTKRELLSLAAPADRPYIEYAHATQAGFLVRVMKADRDGRVRRSYVHRYKDEVPDGAGGMTKKDRKEVLGLVEPLEKGDVALPYEEALATVLNARKALRQAKASGAEGRTSTRLTVEAAWSHYDLVKPTNKSATKIKESDQYERYLSHLRHRFLDELDLRFWLQYVRDLKTGTLVVGQRPRAGGSGEMEPETRGPLANATLIGVMNTAANLYIIADKLGGLGPDMRGKNPARDARKEVGTPNKRTGHIPLSLLGKAWNASDQLCSPWWRDLWRMYVLTGLRYSLMTELRFDEIDFERGVYKVSPHKKGTKRRGRDLAENALGGDNHFVRRSDKHLGRWRELGGGVAAGEFPPPAAPSWPGSTMADRINKRSVHVWNPYYRPTG
ncbi:hypothetical protein [Cupriavidus taiwanensis]|uniref:hypothetical protein n=2 Tax=Cupriavidus taiwanensis TaxID=164546 RepID=UPI001F1219B8|nr:hypothetical protein [Cupriavidus taiwanensis]